MNVVCWDVGFILRLSLVRYYSSLQTYSTFLHYLSFDGDGKPWNGNFHKFYHNNIIIIISIQEGTNPFTVHFIIYFLFTFTKQKIKVSWSLMRWWDIYLVWSGHCTPSGLGSVWACWRWERQRLEIFIFLWMRNFVCTMDPGGWDCNSNRSNVRESRPLNRFVWQDQPTNINIILWTIINKNHPQTTD